MSAIPPMVPVAAPAMSDAVFALTLALMLLAPMAIAGVALINTGLGRSRSAAQAMLGNLALIAVAAIVFAFIGASFAGSLGSKEVVLHAAGKPWSVLGLGSFLLRGLGAAAPQAQLAVLVSVFGCRHVGSAPMGLRRRSLETRRRLRIRGGLGGDRFSARGALDLGRRMACGIGRELLSGRGLS
jgi:hypothetical protein